MADYVSITNAQVQPKAPVTSELVTALRDNPTAIAEGSTGAPRIACKTVFSRRTGASSGYSQFTGASEYGGVWIHCAGSSSDPTTASVILDVSDDGVTYSSAVTILDVPVSESGSSKVFLDFSTGAYHLLATYSDGTASTLSSTIGSYPTGTITHVRWDITSVSTKECAVLAEFQGGETVI